MNTRMLQEQEGYQKFRDERVKAFIIPVNSSRVEDTISGIHDPLATEQAMKNKIEHETRARALEHMKAADVPAVEKAGKPSKAGFFGNLFGRRAEHKVSEKAAEQEESRPSSKK